ncbi:hypothetical protein [Halopenitus persicus]|uniref:hypothetical protein n=1 Tax=Halopenitus persicus TaxID=1048396 RepID=UPI000BBA5EB6|nr:hypothetical protein [Halopenitus persicus]
MPSQPDDGPSDDPRREPAGPRHRRAEKHLGESDRHDAFEPLDGGEAGRVTARRMGTLSYGITAVILASVALVVERDLVPVPEFALSWVTIAGATTMLLTALTRYARTRSRQSIE